MSELSDDQIDRLLLELADVDDDDEARVAAIRAESLEALRALPPGTMVGENSREDAIFILEFGERHNLTPVNAGRVRAVAREAKAEMAKADWDHPTLTREQFAARLEEVARDEAEEPERWWWLSFADSARPAGTQFLGVAIVKARGIIGAVGEARRLGINPGGGVKAFAIPDEHLPDEQLRERLLSRSDLVRAGLTR